MAAGSLAGRLVRLEERMMEAALAHTARRMADAHGVPVGECYAELRSLSQEIAARVGRTSSRRDQHAIMARRYGVDAADVPARFEGGTES